METKIAEFIKIDGQRKKVSDFDLNLLTKEKNRLEDKIANFAQINYNIIRVRKNALAVVI